MGTSNPIFSITADYDVCLIPYSPVSEADELEIRAQVFNSGTDGDVTVHFYLDKTLLDSRTISVKNRSYGLARTFVSMKGHCGIHTVICKRNGHVGLSPAEGRGKLIGLYKTVIPFGCES